MTKRIEYLDAIKGFAIFLMVFAHIIAWSFDDWRTVMYPVVNTPSIINAGLIWHFVYAFHMALFFMVSGYLTYKPIQGSNSGGGHFLYFLYCSSSTSILSMSRFIQSYRLLDYVMNFWD